MRRFVFMAVAVVIVFSARLSTAGEMLSRKVVLDNGLTVLVNEMPAAPLVAVNVLVKTGSANEGKYSGSGISHFVEHMLFKGTHSRPLGQIADEVKSLGGEINAATGYDHTVYTLDVPVESFIAGMDIMADMVARPLFDPQEVEREREVILKELKMRNDQPAWKLGELFHASEYKVHPYSFPIIGRESLFRRITLEDIRDYFNTYYIPNNMIVSVAGPIQSEEVIRTVKERFGSLAPRPVPLRNLPAEPEQITPRYEETAYQTDLVRMIMAYQGVPLLDEDLFAMDVLAMAMGSGKSSRLYRKVYKEMGLVQTIASANVTPMDTGYFQISSTMREDTSAQVRQAVIAVIADIQKNGFSPEELEKIKRQLAVQHVYERETASGMALRAAIEEAFAHDPDFSSKYLNRIKAVTNDDVKRVARKYLVENRLTVVVMKPQQEDAQNGQIKGRIATEVEKAVLPNGLTLLLQEDKTLPVISINLALNSGVRQEPEGLPGLSYLTGSVWQKGFRGKDEDVLSREVEAHGGTLVTYSGKNSLVLSMNFLAEDAIFALDVLEGLLLAPSFSDKEIERVRLQMITALQARKDSVMGFSTREFMETLFLKHPFRRDELGTQESLMKISRRDVTVFYTRFLAANNIVLSIFGDIDKTRIKDEVVKRLGRLERKEVHLATSSEDRPDYPRYRDLQMPKEQALVLVGFHGPTLGSPDLASMEVAENVLASSLSGRMFKKIRDQLGKAYALGGSVSPGVDAGAVLFYALTTNDNVDKVREIILSEITSMAKEGISEKELSDAKISLKSESARSLEEISSRGLVSALDELLGFGWDYYRSFNSRIDAVTAAMVREAALKYLDPAHAAVVVTRSAEQFSNKTE
jgi:zinc protease